VACRVVQAQTLLRVFFNQEVAAITLDDGGHGDIGFPAGIHALIIVVPTGKKRPERDFGTKKVLKMANSILYISCNGYYWILIAPARS
jgi:hypothetical protein